MRQDHTVTTSVLVKVGQSIASFFSHWPGGDVQMPPTDPSGHLNSRAAASSDTFHTNGPTSELFRITNPVASTWTVRLYVASVRLGGELDDLTVNQLTPPTGCPSRPQRERPTWLGPP